ncbi:hypothetical protein CPAR01_04019 [Colletotrichum paranaense]|uniref:Uncharacterized protein n=2 Tax=Colletotrichum acutatum species complex TaxID=2707335 RepID=A0ABQ9PX05_9PEZI|nr:uncharacterized protein CPAR01_04019 [Colletotrichum paranaense]KAK0376079.1 hypothetical protein CLIM01_06550 [Colletotrichum limetticola]KAK1543386.1 hypothetical protein CPAR01_04019 [Colletotrichum paranaense]
MHLISKILYVCVALHVAFQGASGAILRGRTSDADSNQLSASDFQTLSQAAEDLNSQLDNFLRNWSGGHRKPETEETTTIVKRQTSGLSISAQDLQDLLKLIQSIERQLAAIISGSTTASGTVAPAPSNTVNNPGPVASSSPANPGVSSPTPNPVLTNTGNGGPLTTAYGTSVSTGTRCVTTITQTFTEYVNEDGTTAVPGARRSVVDDVEVDAEEDDEPWVTATVPRDTEEDDEWEPWVQFDGTTTEEDESDVGFTTRDSWTELGVKRRDPLGETSGPGLLFVRDEEGI